MDLSQQALETNGKLFSNFEFVFQFLAENLKNEIGRPKWLARPEYGSKCNVLNINRLVSTSSTN